MGKYFRVRVIFVLWAITRDESKILNYKKNKVTFFILVWIDICDVIIWTNFTFNAGF